MRAGAGVVEEQQKCPVTLSEPSLCGQVFEQVFDLVAFKEVGFGGRCPFRWDCRDLLAGCEHFGVAAGDVVEQCVHDGEPLVAGPRVVSSIVFEVAEEPDHEIEIEVGDGELRDLGVSVGGSEAQQDPDRVAVAADRGWAKPFDGHEVIDKERMDGRSERDADHVRPSLRSPVGRMFRTAGSLRSAGRW